MRLFLIGIALPLLAADPLATRVDRVLEGHRAQWGIAVQKLSDGQILYQRCADCFFTPASVTKLFSTSFALARLGGDTRFSTRVLAASAPVNGVVNGHLTLLGGGDPTLTSRGYPYGSPERPALAALEALADQLVSAGVTRIEGDILGDDTLWAWEPVPDGWSHDDLTWDFGAPRSALMVNEGELQVTLLPGARPGDLARVSLQPNVEYFTLDNRVNTVASGQRQIRVIRMPGARQLQITGHMALSDAGWSGNLAQDDPARYAAIAFQQVLQDRGITVEGVARARHRAVGEALTPRPPVTLAERSSPPLSEIVTVINKVSHNLLAEMMLHAAGGVDGLRAYLAGMGIPGREARFEDGSGLSRLTAVTPLSMVRLLAQKQTMESFVESLPHGVVDGSLKNRFGRDERGKRIRAKTGGMTAVKTLAGYIDSPTHGRLAFAIFINDDHGSPDSIRRMDQIALLFTE
ncbi:MAG: D-alanyl-D-alanine carboxypeptidase/D-alanyl-D-alanine-endopeptidase [Bryobacteraceae bacterium]|nr:D-alanyl-D-alanine carboxypeptidase/D-alanyl-D-alanine-endopeptidase [Bryobacteraceae bacterium]